MKLHKLLALTLGLLLAIGMMAACDNTKKEESSNDSSATESASSDEQSAIESEDGGNLLITTTASNGATTATTKAGVTGSNTNLATKTTKTPVGVPTITEDPNDAKAVLPTFNLSSTNKQLVVCIDWDPSSSWVKKWEQAFRACYDTKNEFTISYKIATPAMKASKLAVWKSSGNPPMLST